jgi:DNA-binding transcriptional MerR regulator
MSENEPELYSFEQAAEALGVPVADIRSYVEEGLVEPRPGEGGGPIFTRVEMRRLWSIVTLHRDLGLNLAGVAAVLQLREQFEQVRRDLATLVEIVEREWGPDCWDRLWPEGRPRPTTHISVDGISELPGRADPGGPEAPKGPDAAAGEEADRSAGRS